MRISPVFQTPKFLFLIAIAVLGPLLLSTAAQAETPILPVPPVFSDFDGDHHLDQAHLFSLGSHKQIHVHLRESSSKTLSFDSGMSDPGSLVSGDVDRDGDADLIWISQTVSPVLVFWMGDGRGNFTFISDPETQGRLRRAFLYGNTDWTAVHESQGNGPDGIVRRARSIEMATDAAYAPVLISSENGTRPNIPAFVSSPFLSALRKRGPPATAHR
jgi:hypothetical protein